MQKSSSSEFGISGLRSVVALAMCAVGASLGWFAFAATPANGTLGEATPVLTYTAGPFLQSNPVPVPLVQAGPTCNGTQNPCDSYVLTVSLSPAYIAANPSAAAKVTLFWTDTGTGNSDFDLYVYSGVVANTTASTPVATRSASGANPEVASVFPLQAGDNSYTIKVVPYTVTAETINVRIELLAGSGGSVGFPGFGGADPTVPGNPRYNTYFAPKGTSAEPGSGEMNVGFNPATGRYMLDNAGPVWRVTPPEVANAGTPECCEALWEDRSSTIADAGLDPILWTDQPSGRTFASNFTAGANAAYAYSDSDGEPTMTSPTGWTVLGAALPNGGADHQTIGTGPYPNPLPVGVVPNPILNPLSRAVYYCSQAIVGPAFCQRSDDLGASYGPGTLAYGASDCGGLHGHVRVGPDGAAYVPVPDCSGKAGVAVSIDGGMTWQEFYLPNSLPQPAGSDPSIAIDANNNLYFFYIVSSPDATKGTMHVQVGQKVFDGLGQLTGINWSKDTDLGASHGIINSAFPEAIAGDNGRVAVGFLGTDRAGDFQSLIFPGYWYPFVSTTFDGGNTWVTTNVSPNDPVQGKGGIWQQGGGQTNRNLLDFNEITIDSKGRPAFAYDDGCVGDCVGNPDANSFTAHMRLARQSGGKTLFAAFDPVEPALPKQPCLSGTRDETGSHLKWKIPDNGGADIAYYKIYRGTAAGGETFLADTGSLALPNARPTFDDTTADPMVEHYYYKVQAVNSQGTGDDSNEIDLVLLPLPPTENLCLLPGLTKLTDAEGDSLGGPGTDLKSFHLSQPFAADGVTRLVFTMNTDPGVSPQPINSHWYVAMRLINGTTTTYKGVHMIWNGASPTFESYTPDASSGGTVDGRFVIAGSEIPAEPGSNYDAANGKVVIIVKASDLGLSPGETIAGFVSGVAQGIVVGATLYDQMPESLAYTGNYTLVANTTCSPLLKVVSRKTHGAGDFDLDLPLVGDPAVECRDNGTNSHTLVFSLDRTATVAGSATVTTGNATVGTPMLGPDANQVTVPLTNVANAQHLVITLNGVQDSVGGVLNNLVARMDVLLGDVNANGAVTGADVNLCKDQVGAAITVDTFRDDVNSNGSISGSDVNVVKSQVGTSLPVANPESIQKSSAGRAKK